MIRNFSEMPILSTGGYNDHFLKFVGHVFNTEIVKCRDMIPFVITAIDYLNKHTNDCFFSFSGEQAGIINQCGKLKQDSRKTQQYFSLKEDLYPYLLVNMRSGSAFIRVDSKDEHNRVCGTSIGSSFYWGVLRLLNAFKDPTEAIVAAGKGDSSNIDMSVGDIYGGSYPGIGLPGNLIASSFGKVKDMNAEQLKDLSKDVSEH